MSSKYAKLSAFIKIKFYIIKILLLHSVASSEYLQSHPTNMPIIDFDTIGVGILRDQKSQRSQHYYFQNAEL